MKNADLAELRAQLSAAGQQRRRPSHGALAAFRALLGREPAPLLGPPRAMEMRRPPAPTRVVPDVMASDEPLLLDEPLILTSRRMAFGQRGTAWPLAEDAGLPAPVPRSPLALRIDEVIETPFLPEDLTDLHSQDAELIYAEAGLGSASPEPAPAQALLLTLERRLLAEHMSVIRALADA